MLLPPKGVHPIANTWRSCVDTIAVYHSDGGLEAPDKQDNGIDLLVGFVASQ